LLDDQDREMVRGFLKDEYSGYSYGAPEFFTVGLDGFVSRRLYSTIFEPLKNQLGIEYMHSSLV